MPLVTETARTPRSPPTKAGRIYKIGGVLMLVGLVVTCISYLASPSRDKAGDGELVASGEGELAPSEPTWDPAELAYDDIYIRDGKATVVPDDGITTLAELSGEAPASPATPSEARTIDALFDVVPPEATIVIAIDLPQLLRSPVLTSLVARIVAQTPHGDAFTKTLAAGGADLSKGSALLIAGMPRVGGTPQTLMAFRGSLNTSAVTAHLTAQGAVAQAVGSDTLFTLPQLAVLVRGDTIVFAAPTVITSARAAIAGTSVAEMSALSDPIGQMRASPTGFAVVRAEAALQKRLGTIAPDLSSATWIALGIDTTTGIVFTARAALPSAAIAARAAAHLQASRAQLGLPEATFTSNGVIVEMVAPFDEDDLQGLAVTRA